jgi:hypothetical protein
LWFVLCTNVCSHTAWTEPGVRYARVRSNTRTGASPHSCSSR